MEVLPKCIEVYISESCGCIRLINNYCFLSGCSYKITIPFIETKHESLEKIEEDFPDNETILNINRKLEFLITDDKY